MKKRLYLEASGKGGKAFEVYRQMVLMDQFERSDSYAYLLKLVADESSFGICSSHCVSFDSLFDFVENLLLYGLVGEGGRQRSNSF